MNEKIRLGISSCLLGESVRYDGGHKLDPYLADMLGQYVEWVPVCPEVEYGLPVPREAMHLTGDPDRPRLVTRETRIDHTEGMLRWAEKKLATLEKKYLCGFVFKSRSPSSGLRGVEVHTGSGKISQTGSGIFAKAFIDRFPFIPVEEDEGIHDLRIRENFIARVFDAMQWRGIKKNSFLYPFTDK